MQGNRSRDTRPEVAIRSAVHHLGLRYGIDSKPLSGLRCKADLVFRQGKVAVFVDGCFWHGCPGHGRRPETNPAYWSAKISRNMARDQRNNNALLSAGWLPLRVWEHEDPEDAAKRIAILVRTRRGQGA
jgi:DNA mismatch endonuclease (patch repair protein)